MMIIISGPSGVGKDSVLRELKKRNLPIYHVVTANTRPPRPDEKEGVDYYFVTKHKFEKMIADDELLEYSHVYKDYKGVPKSEVRKAIESDKDVILRLDVQGAEKIKKMYPFAISIFLMPPNQETWMRRLGKRKQQGEHDLETRIATFKEEMQKANAFDYIVINAQDELSDTVDVITSIINAEHHKSSQTPITV